MKPDISIVVPFYNSAAFIGATLDSLLAQTLKSWECLLVDDGSSDGSAAIASSYAAADSRFSVLNRPKEQPKGANSCRNLGLEKAVAPFLIFLDADDLLLPKALEDRLNAFKHHQDQDALVFSFRAFTADGPSADIGNHDPASESAIDYLKAFLAYQIPWQTTCPIWKRDFLLKNKGFDVNFQRFQDVEFHTRMLLAGAAVKRIHKEDLRYRASDGHNKYQDPEFLKVITKAITAYINKFSTKNGQFKNGLLSSAERLSHLHQTAIKLIDKFLLPQRQWGLISSLLEQTRSSGIFTPKQARAIRVYCWMQRSRNYKRKGFGMYRVYSWSRRVSGLKSELAL